MGDYSIQISEKNKDFISDEGERNCEYYVIRYLCYKWGDIVLFEMALRLVVNVYCKL